MCKGIEEVRAKETDEGQRVKVENRDDLGFKT